MVMNYLLPITDRDLYYKVVWRWITGINDTDWAANQHANALKDPAQCKVLL